MARQRRGGGFKPPELRGTLGTLLNTALQQAGVVRDAARDVFERGAREGRTRLDDLRSSRRRQEALAELGEVVLALIRRGEIDVAELPEARDIVDHLDELDAAADEDSASAASRDSTPTVPPPSRRNRFDDRDREPAPARAPKTLDDDGTVSSGRWTPPPRRPGKATKIWKPRLDAEPEAGDDLPPTSPGHKALPIRDPARKGGISFDDDDLADYMHPDDVPPKKSGD